MCGPSDSTCPTMERTIPTRSRFTTTGRRGPWCLEPQRSRHRNRIPERDRCLFAARGPSATALPTFFAQSLIAAWDGSHWTLVPHPQPGMSDMLFAVEAVSDR